MTLPRRDGDEPRSVAFTEVAGHWLIGVCVVVALFLGWHPKRDIDEPNAPTPSKPRSFIGRAMRNFAIQDWIVVVYVFILLGAALHGGGNRRPTAVVLVAVDMAVLWTSLLITRGKILRPGLPASLVYRAAMIGVIIATFLQLHYILPAARSATYDSNLYAFDKHLFGMEPAEFLDRFVTPRTTEWFSFFYYSYFFLIVSHVFPMLLVERRMQVLGEFTLGIVTVVCVGHVVYLLVPGFGPYRELAGHFHRQLVGSFWWPLVRSTVDSVEGSNRTDIFPSLHTAIPTFLTLFSVRHRALRPFRYTWPILAFFASQIIVATMFLRWHYLIDIIAGVTLAYGASRLMILATAEQKQRERAEKSPVWEPVLLNRTP